MCLNNNDHGVHVYLHWNNNNKHKNTGTTKPTPATTTNTNKQNRSPYCLTETLVKDNDISTKHTLETLCTLNSLYDNKENMLYIVILHSILLNLRPESNPSVVLLSSDKN